MQEKKKWRNLSMIWWHKFWEEELICSTNASCHRLIWIYSFSEGRRFNSELNWNWKEKGKWRRKSRMYRNREEFWRWWEWMEGLIIFLERKTFFFFFFFCVGKNGGEGARWTWGGRRRVLTWQSIRLGGALLGVTIHRGFTFSIWVFVKFTTIWGWFHNLTIHWCFFKDKRNTLLKVERKKENYS